MVVCFQGKKMYIEKPSLWNVLCFILFHIQSVFIHYYAFWRGGKLLGKVQFFEKFWCNKISVNRQSNGD